MKSKRIKKTLFNRKGYTIPTALILMFLLFAFATGILLFASYNYNNAYKRQEQLQLYLYSKNILDECEYSIRGGKLNEFLSDVMKETDTRMNAQNKGYYGSKYEFRLSLKDSDLMKNPFANETIDIELFVQYKPNKGGEALPDKEQRYIMVGDKMEVEYRITQKTGGTGNEMSFQILSEYYCSYDFNRNSDGTYKDQDKQEVYTNMKWEPFQYTGKIYTK